MPGRARLRISIVGAGPVGSTLALLLRRRGHAIVSVISGSKRSARQLATLVGCRHWSTDLASIAPETNAVLIAVPDKAMGSVARSLAQNPHLRFDRLVAFHTSGVMTSDLLRPLRKRGSTVFSLHPIQSFPKDISPRQQARGMNGVWYGFEGTLRSESTARLLVGYLGGKMVRIPKERKILYHLACVFASNYAVVLIGVLERLAGRLGWRDLRPLSRLFLSSAGNAMSQGAAKALTGPIRRGNPEVLRMHIMALRRLAPDLGRLYRALGNEALRLRGDVELTKKRRREIARILGR